MLFSFQLLSVAAQLGPTIQVGENLVWQGNGAPSSVGGPPSHPPSISNRAEQTRSSIGSRTASDPREPPSVPITSGVTSIPTAPAPGPSGLPPSMPPGLSSGMPPPPMSASSLSSMPPPSGGRPLVPPLALGAASPSDKPPAYEEVLAHDNKLPNLPPLSRSHLDPL